MLPYRTLFFGIVPLYPSSLPKVEEGISMQEIAPYLNFTASIVNIDPRNHPTYEV